MPQWVTDCNAKVWHMNHMFISWLVSQLSQQPLLSNVSQPAQMLPPPYTISVLITNTLKCTYWGKICVSSTHMFFCVCCLISCEHTYNHDKDVDVLNSSVLSLGLCPRLLFPSGPQLPGHYFTYFMSVQSRLNLYKITKYTHLFGFFYPEESFRDSFILVCTSIVFFIAM